MPWLRRERAAWTVPLLLFLAVLLVAALAFNVANLEIGEETVPAAPAGGTDPRSLLALEPSLVDGLLIFFLGVSLGAALYLIITNRNPSTREAKRASWRELVSSILALAFILAVVLAWPRMVQTLRPGNETADSTTGTSGSGDPTLWPTAVGAPLGLFLAFAVLGTILVATYFLRRNAGGFGSEADVESSADRREASVAVQATIEELELGGDVRNAILACFQRFCRLLGARGLTEQSALTSRELKRLAVDRLRVSPDASETLTALFEEARYSEHAFQEADRTRAIESLTGIRAALEA